MSDRKTSSHFLVCLLSGATLFLPGCVDVDPSRIPKENSANQPEPEELQDDAYYAKREAEGWHDFEEPIGDESYAEVQLTPKEPIVGQSTKLVFIAGSSYGVPVGVKIWARVGDPNRQIDWHNPGNDPAWTEMKAVSAQVWDDDSGNPREVPVDFTAQDEMQGEIRFEAELTFPAGESPVEFKIDPGWDGSRVIGFEGWRVTAKSGETHLSD